jgi:hypothetical protein
VIALPRQLAPWAPHLALFPEDIALALGPLVIRLSQLIGAARIDHGREGTPDGYDGIDRRGSYDRLLASEWLIHDELPDEFLRRVVSGEHAFLRRLHRHEAAGRRTIALFDSGTDQLGAPRIAHVAALIVLAQRAERAGATLAWGILQEQDGALRTPVTENAVRALIDSRCTGRVSHGDIARWMAADGVAGASEIWLVGPERLAQESLAQESLAQESLAQESLAQESLARESLARESLVKENLVRENLVQQSWRRQASVLAVSDVLEPGAPPRIKLTVSGSQALRPRTVTLDVPEQRAAVQLLRDPFGNVVTARHKALAGVDVRSAMVFSADGRRLYLRTAEGGLLTIQIPNSPRAQVGKPAVFKPPAGHVVAVGVAPLNKRALVICRHADEAVVHLLRRRGRTAGMTERFGGMAAGTDDGLLRPLGLLAGRQRPDGTILKGVHLCFVDANGHCVLINGGRLTTYSGKSVVASRATRDAFVYIERSVLRTYSGKSAAASRAARDASVHNERSVLTSVKVMRAGKNGELELTTAAVDLHGSSGDTRYYFGAGGLANLIAYSPVESRCTIVHRLQIVRFDVPPSHTVIGMVDLRTVEHGRTVDKPFAVAIDGNRTAIELLRPGECRRLLTTTAPITSAAASDADRLIAFITESGELGVYSCGVDLMVLRLAPETMA